MTKEQKEVLELALLTDEQEDLRMEMHYLAPWIDKTDGLQSVADWETTMAIKMMVKLLGLWLTQEGREQVEKILEFYHPSDRSALAYALVVYVMTGVKMKFKNPVAKEHYNIILKKLKDDMAELTFAGHMRYMMRKYGPKKVKR